MNEKKSIGQKWPEYNEAQTKEKLLFYKLLDELLSTIPERIYSFGRPRKSLRDMIFACMIKIYSNTSARRTISDLELAKEAGYISEVPHFNTVLNYFDDSGMKIILDYLVTLTALPLKFAEENFAIDSSGIGMNRFDRWKNHKYSLKPIPQDKFMKLHIICGVKTNIITTAKVTLGNVNDQVMFEPLLNETADNFHVKEIYADKGYISRANLDLANKLQIMPYIPFKCNAIGRARGSPTWARMYRMFMERGEEFAQHYHLRSNVESTFSMIKRKFGDFCRCKTERSMVNEILCKVLAHNITCLIHETFELGIEIDFKETAQSLPAQKVV